MGGHLLTAGNTHLARDSIATVVVLRERGVPRVMQQSVGNKREDTLLLHQLLPWSPLLYQSNVERPKLVK